LWQAAQRLAGEIGAFGLRLVLRERRGQLFDRNQVHKRCPLTKVEQHEQGPLDERDQRNLDDGDMVDRNGERNAPQGQRPKPTTPACAGEPVIARISSG
jgi:hypothetical protein